MSDLVSIRSPEVDRRKSLFVAILVTAVGAALIFILARTILIDQDFIGTIYEKGVPRALAGLSLLAFPYLHQRLAGKRRNHFSHLPDTVVPFEAYTLPWYIVFAYGVLIAFAIAYISLLLVWLIGLVTGVFMTRATPISTWIILLVTFYYLGFWAGTRNTQRPFLIAMGIVLVYTILEFFVGFALKIDSPLRSIPGLVIFLITFLVAALIGAHIGKRRHLLSYIRFLLSQIAEHERPAIMDNLYREVKQQIDDQHQGTTGI